MGSDGEGRDGEGRGEEGRGVKGRGEKGSQNVTYIHTEPPTKRVLEEHSLLKYILCFQWW